MTHNGTPDLKYLTLSLKEKNLNGDENKWFKSKDVLITELEKTFKSQNYSTIIWSDGNRDSDNFHFATGFSVDIDNGLTISEAETRLKEKNLCYWLIPSRNHSSALHKFHIIIPFNYKIYSLHAYKRIAENIANDIFPECDYSVKDGARFMFGSPRDKDFIDHSDGNNYDVTKTGGVWDDSLQLVDKDGNEITPDEVEGKLQIFCPFHEDNTASAFMDYSENSENWFIRCSACSTTFWKEEIKTWCVKYSDRFWSLGKDV
jgi:hypothetical protein